MVNYKGVQQGQTRSGMGEAGRAGLDPETGMGTGAKHSVMWGVEQGWTWSGGGWMVEQGWTWSGRGCGAEACMEQ